MQLSEQDIQRILSELLEEAEVNRMDRLRLQKYPEEIIEFAYEFATSTTKDPGQKEAILRNQYIPWIAEQAKKNPEIINDKEKLGRSEEHTSELQSRQY